MAAIFATGDAVNLLPVELSRGLNAGMPLAFGPTPTALGARTRPGAVRHAVRQSPAGHGGGTRPGAPPSGPPGSATAGGGAGAPGGASSGLWCAVLVVLLALTYQELRGHRLRPVLTGPVGVVSLLQRPG
jgi:hypothetical protein